MTDGSPIRGYAPLWREVVEGVLADARRTLAEPRRGELAAVLDRTLEAMQSIEETRWSDPEHLEWLGRASAGLEAALAPSPTTETEAALHRRLRSLLGEVLDVRDQTLDGVARLRGEDLRAARPPDAVDARGFTASEGVPALFKLERAFVRSFERVETEIDLDAAWRALEEEAREAEARGAPPPESPELSVDATATRPRVEPRHPLHALARDCLDEIGGMGLLRVVDEASPYTDGVARFEQRLLDSLDGLMSLGWREAGALENESIDVVAVTQAYADDAFVADPMRAFARTFVLCSVEGADGVRAAVRILRASHRTTWQAQRDAMALSAHPEVGPAMRRLASEGDPDLALFALSVLRWRGDVDFGACALALSHPSAAVRAEAARGLTFGEGRAAATELLTSSMEDEGDRSARLVFAESLVVLDAPAGLVELRAALDRLDPGDPAAHEAAGPALLLLALAGGAPDLARLSAWASTHSSWITAVGWFGHVALVEPMLDKVVVLSEWSESLVSAARALERITGESMLHEPEAHGGAHGYRLPPRQWHAWWAERARDLDPTIKHRFGRPFAVAESLAELARVGVTGGDRDLAALEVAICTGGRVRVEPRDWSARHRVTVEQARRTIESEGRTWHRPGEWPADRLGRRGLS